MQPTRLWCFEVLEPRTDRRCALVLTSCSTSCSANSGSHFWEANLPLARPFRRTCRQFVDGKYSGGGRTDYIRHLKFARTPQQYIRAFLLIQKDLLELFDYVEPSDVNLKCYSYRIHELHTRTCIEIEANCKAILGENGYTKAGNWNMDDYRKLNATHRLSSYQVKLPLWHGNQIMRAPFAPWKASEPLVWYQAYNQTKHDRHEQFEQANFENLLDATFGLVALVSAQFHRKDFSPHDYLVSGDPGEGIDVAIGEYFLVKFPDDWPVADRYEFDWEQLKNEPDPFQSLAF